MRPTDMRRSFCDNAEAAEILGWYPQVPLKTALELTVTELCAARSKVTPMVFARGAH